VASSFVADRHPQRTLIEALSGSLPTTAGYITWAANRMLAFRNVGAHPQLAALILLIPILFLEYVA
jgi:hypothetical protein